MFNKYNFASSDQYLKLFTDVTYIEMVNYKNLYLSSILYSYSNKIVVKSISIRNNKHSIISSLNQMKKRIENGKTIINTDHGSIYYSKEYIKLPEKYFATSTIRKGNWLDNKPIEYFFQS